MTQVALRPAPCTSLGLPLKKRKSKFDKDSEPPVAVLCENGLAICKSLGINSAHLKRTSNCPHVAVTITHPETEKRKSIALWKIITARVEAGWSVQYLNGDATDLRNENLKTVEPGERDTQADADTKHIVELNAKLRALPLSAEQQAKVQRQTEVFERLTSEEQKAFHAYLCGAARKSIKTNFRLVEDVVSEIFAS